MRKSIVKITATVMLMAILASSVFVMTACSRQDDSHKGIQFDPGIEHIKQIDHDFAEAMTKIIEAVFAKIKIGTQDNDIKDSILKLAKKSDDLLRQSGITQQQYNDLTADLFANCEKYSDMIISYVNHEPMEQSHKDDTMASVLSLALSFCSVLGKDKFSKFIYDLVEYRIEERIEHYKGQSTALAGSDREKWEKKLVIYQSLNLDEFEKLLCGSLLVLDMFSATIDAGDFALSDSEMAKLLEIPDLDVDFDSTQWNFILTELGAMLPKSSYAKHMYDVAVGLQKGGIMSLSMKLAKTQIGNNEYPSVVFTLITHIQAMFDADMIKKIRAINAMPTYDEDPEIEKRNIAAKDAAQDQLVLDIIKKASDEDWALFKSLLNIGIEKNDTTIDAYCEKAVRQSGNKVSDYSLVEEGSVPFLQYKENILSYDEYLKIIANPENSKYEKVVNGVADRSILLVYVSKNSITNKTEINIDQAVEALKNATVDNVRYIAEGILGSMSPAFTYGLHNKLKRGNSTVES